MQSSAEGNLRWFHISAAVNWAGINIGIPVDLSSADFISFGYSPRSWKATSNSILSIMILTIACSKSHLFFPDLVNNICKRKMCGKQYFFRKRNYMRYSSSVIEPLNRYRVFEYNIMIYIKRQMSQMSRISELFKNCF